MRSMVLNVMLVRLTLVAMTGRLLKGPIEYAHGPGARVAIYAGVMALLMALIVHAVRRLASRAAVWRLGGRRRLARVMPNEGV